MMGQEARRTVAEYKHDYYIAHKEMWQNVYGPRQRAKRSGSGKSSEESRRYYAAHKEARALSSKRYHLAHAEELRAKAAEYRKMHKMERSARRAAAYWSDPEKYREKTRQWMARHPNQPRYSTVHSLNTFYANRRRVSLRGNGGTHTEAEWQEKLDLLGNVCIYCGESKPLTRDHKVPLSRGGTDDIMNIVPACRSCNSRKRTRTSMEFLGLTKAA